MKEIIFVFLLYSFIGTILHFTYNLSNNNIVVGIFSAVNESVWEHIKILLTPIFIYNSICYILKYQTNYYIMLLTELLTAIFGIIILYKLKILLFNNKYKILNIFIFYIVSFLASLLGYIIKNINVPIYINYLSIIGIIIIYFMFMLFTVCAPKKSIFKDPVSGTYGVNCCK